LVLAVLVAALVAPSAASAAGAKLWCGGGLERAMADLVGARRRSTRSHGATENGYRALVHWIKGHWFQVVLLTAMVTLLSVQAAPAAVSPVRRGAWYKASGRQPHYSRGAFTLRFQVTPNGRRVTSLAGEFLIPCSGAPVKARDAIAVQGGSVAIKNRTFRAVVPVSAIGPDSTVTVTGRFSRGGLARGTLRYRGTGAYSGCKADGSWTGHAWPILPVQHFVGKTSQGTTVTFERTIEAHPRVTRFDFGPLTGTSDLFAGPCTNGGTGTPGLDPPWAGFALAVRHGRFSGESSDTVSFTTIVGRFVTSSRASGTVSYTDRGDCAIHATWTAHLLR
jgi:hypothetical protein